MQEKVPSSRFSVGRFVVMLGFAAVVFGLGRKQPDAPMVLLTAGMVFLAFFSGVFDPLTPTKLTERPSTVLGWLAFAAGIMGIVLILFSAGLRLR
ncbi:hypothetical protein [Pseudoxanthomonas taiwanensis]|uniref:hypothetical protein n=1 Tax=Pseudoxanthomonas taiwanensis TaxID=176598 RepID=UPI00138A2A91|nr:hypothetical protein [Pseudoxanthomonas taiwanensis]